MTEESSTDAVVMRSADELREQFESIMVDKHYTILRNSDGEYDSAAVFHMWTGYCLSAVNNGVAEKNEYGLIDGYS